MEGVGMMELMTHEGCAACGYGRVEESASCYDDRPCTERDIQCVWYDARLRPERLLTHAGEAVRVIEPGRWNLEAGPDFLDAILEIGPDRRRVMGDVEIHVHSRDWLHHGHGDDPAYARVVAHVTFDDAPLPVGALPAGTLQLSLRLPLLANPQFSFEAIDPTAYPFATLPPTQRPCERALADWSPDEHQALLRAAGRQRLAMKAARIKERIREVGAEQALYEETLVALGYKQNGQAFRRLARQAPLARLRNEADGDMVTAYAILVGLAGLMPEKTQERWDAETRTFVRDLWDRWWKRRAAWDGAELPRPLWKLAGGRPHNHPLRRMAAAAALFGAAKMEWMESLVHMVGTEPLAGLRRAAAALQEAAVFPFWEKRLGLSSKPGVGRVDLIGSDRVAAWLTNVAVPWLAAQGNNMSAYVEAVPGEADNAHHRQTRNVLFGHDHNAALFNSGLVQQGLLQIFHDFCLNARNDCRGCRFVSALSRSGHRGQI